MEDNTDNVSIKAGFHSVDDMPAQHIRLFAPWIFDADSPDFIKHYKSIMSESDYKDIIDALHEKDSRRRMRHLFKSAMKALDTDVKARSILKRFFEVYPKAEEFRTKILFNPPDCAYESFKVYYQNFLAYASQESVLDKVIVSLYCPSLIKYFENSTERFYKEMAKKLRPELESQGYSSTWKIRCELVINLILSKPQKRKPEHWYPELLKACDDDPNTRGILPLFSKDYKQIIRDHTASLLTEKPKTYQQTDFIDDDAEVPTEPRPQSLFGKRPDDITGDYAGHYELRGYQKELVGKAKEGKSTIICAPTGSGKTIVALDIMIGHLRQKRSLGKTGRIAMLVPTIPLVTQQSNLLTINMKPEFFVDKISGAEKVTEGGNLRTAATLLRADVIVLTPQIFINMLLSPLKSQKIYITDFTMFIFDECHHCNEQHPYNVLMDQVRVSSYQPQIVGLTASVGDGGDSRSKIDPASAMEHMLQLCARLNVTTVSSVRDPDNEDEMLFHVSRPVDEIVPVRPSEKDDFAHEIALLADYIESKMHDDLFEAIKELPQIKDSFRFPLEGYEGKNGSVKSSFRYNGQLATIKHEVDKNYTGNPERRLFLMKCFELLEIFHFTLKNNQLLPAVIAFEYFNERLKAFDRFDLYKDLGPDSPFVSYIERLKEFAVHIKGKLPNLDKHVAASNEKPILNKLIQCIYDQYNSNPTSRIMIFLESRKSCAKLAQYLKRDPTIAQTFGPNAVSHLVSVNQSATRFGQSAASQEEALKRFRLGDVNVLLATSVAEEGLDVAQCNLIIKYNSVGSEKSYIQRRGRARAKESRSILLALNDIVEQAEYRNIMREFLMNSCLKCLQAMNELQLRQQIYEKKKELLAKLEEDERRMNVLKKDSIIYKLDCITCGLPICLSSEIARLMESQFICCSPEGWVNTTIKSRQQKGFTAGVSSLCGEWMCKCGSKRGEVIKYGEAFLPTIAATAFRLKKYNGPRNSTVDRDPKNFSDVDLGTRTLTWKHFTSKYFVVGSITSAQIKDMISALADYDLNAFIEAETNEKKGILDALDNMKNYKRKEKRVLVD